MNLKDIINNYYNKIILLDASLIEVNNDIMNNYETKYIYDVIIKLDISKGGDFNCVYHNDFKNKLNVFKEYCKDNNFYLNAGSVYILNSEFYVAFSIDISKNFEDIF